MSSFSVLEEIIKKIRKAQLYDKVLDLFIPPQCYLCNSFAIEKYDRILCEECANGWQRIEICCFYCGDILKRNENTADLDPICDPNDCLKLDKNPTKEHPIQNLNPEYCEQPLCNNLCNNCIEMKPPFNKSRSLFVYDGIAKRAIHSLKYEGSVALGTLMGKWMAKAIPELFSETDYDCIVPVPLYWRRKWWRGYNQSEVLAESISKELEIPLVLDIKRTRNTDTQTKLGLKARKNNVKEVFMVTSDNSFEKKKILLVDDVFTTGATAISCTTTLLNKNAQIVDVLTLARALEYFKQ